MRKLIYRQKIGRKEEANKLKDGARLHTSEKTWRKYGPANSLGGTGPRHMIEKPSAAACMSLGTKNGVDPTLESAPKKYQSRFYQLKVGHGAVGAFLARTGAIETPECWCCGEEEQSVEHLYMYTKYRRWRKGKKENWQRILQRRCRIAGSDRTKVACRVAG